MDTALVTNTISKLKEFYQKNKKIMVVFILFSIIVYATYLYTPNRRIKSKIEYVTNHLVYDKKRVQIDFCGIDNDIADTLRSSIRFNIDESSIESLNPNINLYDLGLTSEYMLDITGSNENDNIYKIHSVISSSKLILLNHPKINESNDSPNCEVTYFRPSSNENVYKHKKLCEYYIASAYRPYLI